MDVFASIMRTVVPLVAGLVVGTAARAGLDLDGEQVAAGVTAAASAGYYAAFRAAEEWADRIGWEPLRRLAGVLLGWARPPQYPAPGQRPTATVRLRLDREDLDRQFAEFFRGGRRGGS